MPKKNIGQVQSYFVWDWSAVWAPVYWVHS